MIHSILSVQLHAWQSFCTTSLQVLFGLPLGLAPSISYSIHFFTQSLSSFRNTCPYHRSLFCCSNEIMLSNPNLSLNSTWNSIFYLNVTYSSDLSHLCRLKCHLIFFSYRPGLTSMQHTTLHTTAVQFPFHYQWYILIGKRWYQLPEFSPSNLNSALHSCISISIHTQQSTCHLNNKTYPLTPDLHWHQYLHLCDLYVLLDSSNLYK